MERASFALWACNKRLGRLHWNLTTPRISAGRPHCVWLWLDGSIIVTAVCHRRLVDANPPAEAWPVSLASIPAKEEGRGTQPGAGAGLVRGALGTGVILSCVPGTVLARPFLWLPLSGQQRQRICCMGYSIFQVHGGTEIPPHSLKGKK